MRQLHDCQACLGQELKGNRGHCRASLKRGLDLEFQHYGAGEKAPAAATVVLHAETSLEVTIEEFIVPKLEKLTR